MIIKPPGKSVRMITSIHVSAHGLFEMWCFRATPASYWSNHAKKKNLFIKKFSQIKRNKMNKWKKINEIKNHQNRPHGGFWSRGASALEEPVSTSLNCLDVKKVLLRFLNVFLKGSKALVEEGNWRAAPGLLVMFAN